MKKIRKRGKLTGAEEQQKKISEEQRTKNKERKKKKLKCKAQVLPVKPTPAENQEEEVSWQVL